MQIGDTFGTRKLANAFPGLVGASLGSVLKMSVKPMVTGKLIRQLKDQRTVDDLLKTSVENAKLGNTGVIVQVGANDGQHSDPLRDILASGNVKAVLVEPMPIAFEALHKLYAKNSNIRLVNNAISAKGGKLVLYTPEIKGKELQSTLWANPSREQALREVKRIMGNKVYKNTKIKKISIEALTAADLCKKQRLKPKDIKILVCDTEGQDASIIGSFLDADCRPDIIFYEKLHVKPPAIHKLNTRLEKLGYRLTQSNKDVYASKA